MNRLPKLYGTMVWFCWNSRTSSSNRFPNMFQYRWWFRNPKQPVEGKVVFPMYCTTGFNTIRGGGAWFLVFQGTDPWKHLRFWSSAGHHICWASVEAHLYLEKRPRTSNFQCPTRKSYRNLVEKYKCHKDDVNQFLHFDQKVVCFKVSLVWLQKKTMPCSVQQPMEDFILQQSASPHVQELCWRIQSKTPWCLPPQTASRPKTLPK